MVKEIVIIVASERRGGNCDLLCRYAEKLSNDGLSIKSIYLKDFQIKQCQGCMSCVFKNMRCKLDDNLYKLMEVLNSADALLLISPTYVLTIPGKLKMLMDRFLCMYDLVKGIEVRPAISIGVASPIAWDQFQISLMNVFLLQLGCKVIDSFIINGAGQGEVLLEAGAERVKSAIEKLTSYQYKPYESCVSKHCPVDYCKLFEHEQGNIFRCPVCFTPAVLKEDGFYFDSADLNNNRWTKENIKEHFEGWIMGTKERFIKLLPQIYKKKKELGL